MKKLTLNLSVFICFLFAGCADTYLPVDKGDTDPPEIIETSPENGESGVSKESTVTVKFSKGVSPLTIHEESIILMTGNHEVDCEIELSEDWTEVELTPLNELTEGKVYIVKIARTITDINGLPLKTDGTDSPYRFSFSVETIFPVVVETFPEEGAVVSPSELEAVTVRFSKPMDILTIDESTVYLADVWGDVTYDKETQTASFIPDAPLSYGTDYKLIVTGKAKDSAGLNIQEDFIVNFITSEE